MKYSNFYAGQYSYPKRMCLFFYSYVGRKHYVQIWKAQSILQGMLDHIMYKNLLAHYLPLKAFSQCIYVATHSAVLSNFLLFKVVSNQSLFKYQVNTLMLLCTLPTQINYNISLLRVTFVLPAAK